MAESDSNLGGMAGEKCRIHEFFFLKMGLERKCEKYVDDGQHQRLQGRIGQRCRHLNTIIN
ncbi:hypothetical protein, partial [Escherichia coli]|uniref:hypothetical protein n=1 Tax=Escherichia coli TaxID=562 RepID=UPI001BB092CA